MQYRKIQFTNQIKTNLYHYLNYELLDRGYWRSVASGTSDNAGNFLSKCVLDNTDSSYPSGSVWKSPRENWIHETNVSVPSGTINVPSGVWVNGVFRTPTDSTYGHVYDYNNGRVIFTSGARILPHKSVLASYSFKEYSLKIASGADALRLNNDYFANDGIGDEEFPFNTVSTPAIYIVMNNHKMIPLAIGGGQILHKNVSIHVLSNDQHENEASDIVDMFTFKKDAAINMLDINTLPELLNWRGSKSSSYIDYKTLKASESYYWNRMYILDVETIELPIDRKNHHHFRIDFLIEIRGVQET